MLRFIDFCCQIFGFWSEYGRTKNKLFFFCGTLFLCWGLLPIWCVWFYTGIWKVIRNPEDRTFLGFVFTNTVLTGFFAT